MGADAIVRDAVGYRLGVDPAEVDSVRLSGARARRRGGARRRRRPPPPRWRGRRSRWRTACPQAGDGEAGPLAELRRAAAGDVATARVILARASSRTGAHAAGAARRWRRRTPSAPTTRRCSPTCCAARPRCAGPARRSSATSATARTCATGSAPTPASGCARAHRDLLALDRPVRSGVRYDATSLLGRDGDIGAAARAAGRAPAWSRSSGRAASARRGSPTSLARDAAQPVVHVVELVGVTAAEDVVGEVGSALGVRDSVSGRRTLTPEQRADVRARIAQRLGAGAEPAGAGQLRARRSRPAAELVAFLVSATRRPARAHHEPRAARDRRRARLPARRARAGRRGRAVPRARRSPRGPACGCPRRSCAASSTRLDGLPLAIELAAAKVRAMSVEEIDRRLEDRFALLRGGDRSAPDRHQTLLAVIDWSWNLLDDGERRALRRLALFNDGFTLEAAEAVLGDGALDAVQGLVDQSLLSVRETAAGVRYRMLETVREFGRMQLGEAGEDAEARAAPAGAGRPPTPAPHGAGLSGASQFAAIDALAAEEINLADELRGAIADGDRGALVELLAALGMFWTIRGEHARLIVLTAGGRRRGPRLAARRRSSRTPPGPRWRSR